MSFPLQTSTMQISASESDSERTDLQPVSYCKLNGYQKNVMCSCMWLMIFTIILSEKFLISTMSAKTCFKVSLVLYFPPSLLSISDSNHEQGNIDFGVSDKIISLNWHKLCNYYKDNICEHILLENGSMILAQIIWGYPELMKEMTDSLHLQEMLILVLFLFWWCFIKTRFFF